MGALADPTHLSTLDLASSRGFFHHHPGGRRSPTQDAAADDSDSDHPYLHHELPAGSPTSATSGAVAVDPPVHDPRDAGTADAWVERSPSLTRLTGKHTIHTASPPTSEADAARLHHPGAAPLRAQPRRGATWRLGHVGRRGGGPCPPPGPLTMDELVREFGQLELPVTLACSSGAPPRSRNMTRQTLGFHWGPGPMGARFCRTMGSRCGSSCLGTRPGRMVKWLRRIVVTTAESDNYYHHRDNRLFPSHVDAKLAEAEGAGQKVTRVELTLDGGETWLLCSVNHPERPTKYGKVLVLVLLVRRRRVADLPRLQGDRRHAHWGPVPHTHAARENSPGTSWVKINVMPGARKVRSDMAFEHRSAAGVQATKSGGWMARQKHLDIPDPTATPATTTSEGTVVNSNAHHTAPKSSPCPSTSTRLLRLGSYVDVKGPTRPHVEYAGTRRLPRRRRETQEAGAALAMVAGGSGITPIYQVIQAVLRDQPAGRDGDATSCMPTDGG
ncbi:hypothetical protein HU200_011984 [Digitaria exilis]|uniref:Uncharacterized protein n=1 Tax=Digitaria exilis TaxID=1010633 RepID=A0A835FFG5_9POAL|nr:hypothetical protein HU200_011984 [Digitaria exilis]